MNCEFPPVRAADARPNDGASDRANGRSNVGSLGRVVLPPHARGMRIGLFGGTFDPPHAAHRAACLLAMRRLGLDRVWWLVTPGNPLKDTHGLTPLAERIAAARALAHHPRIDVTDLEADLGTNYTFQTIHYLVQRCPGVQFVWIMGADNLRHFHRWQRWRDIANAGADRGGRSAWTKSLFGRGRCRQRLGLGAHSGNGGAKSRRTKAASLAVFARLEVALVVDGAARRARLEDAYMTSGRTLVTGFCDRTLAT